MKTIAISCFLIFVNLFNVNAQDLNKSFYEEKVGYNILIDQCNRAGLEGEEFGIYFKEYYSDYTSNEKMNNALSSHLDGINIKIVLGTWCHDSKMQVPRFMKVLDQISYIEEKLEIICVDRSKKTHGISIEDLNIKYVPTFIFYKDGKEIGRIIESPEKSLEEDFLNIVNQ